MNALQRTTRTDVYVLNAPAFAAALTRSNGVASANLRGRLLVALHLQDTAEIKFSKSPKSGRWYVYAAAAAPAPTKLQARKNRRAAAAAKVAAAAGYRPCTVFAHMLECGDPQELTTFNSIDEAVAFMREEEMTSHPDIAYWAEESGTNNVYDSTYELLDIADRPSSTAKVQDIDASVDGDIPCARCASTGRFITEVVNGKPVGPGGNCYRCAGKGHHNHADRARNLHHDNHFVPNIV